MEKREIETEEINKQSKLKLFAEKFVLHTFRRTVSGEFINPPVQ